jgi:Ca2+-binding RTX toxin-like protein
MIRPVVLAIAALAIAAPAASAHDDAEIFATDNTATITDQKDPRLDARLDGFARRVEDIIRAGGARPRGSELLDGVFCCDLTFERSRRFAVDRTDATELHDIAETIRRRFLQGSVLTFTPRAAGDAVELDVPKVSAKALRDGLQNDPEAAGRLFGGSVTQDRHLLLVADGADADFARAFAKKIGGDVKHATVRAGDREFVSAATDGRARLEKRTLVITGTDADDVIALHDSGRRLAIDFGDDGVIDFEPSDRRFDRIRVEGGEGFDTLIRRGDDYVGVLDSVERVDIDAPRVTVDDLSQQGVGEVHVSGADRVTVNASAGQDNIDVSAFQDTVFVLGPTFVEVDGAETTDRLRVNARDGHDSISASTAAMRLTLDGGDGGGTIFGGPGDDVLIGGDGFDDVNGRHGDDVARMGADFDRFSWAPGDGSDSVEGGGSHDSIFVTGSNDAETFGIAPFRRGVRFSRDVGATALDLDSVEEIDTIALGGADTFKVADLSGTGVDLVDMSLAPSFGTADGDKAADRIEATGAAPAKVTGQTVVSGAVTVTGLAARLQISHSDGLLDTLALDAPAVDTSGLQPGTIGIG